MIDLMILRVLWSASGRSIRTGVLLCTWCLPFSCVLPVRAGAPAEHRWTTEGFAGFSHGTFGASGANLYASAQGKLEMINLFDLNRDGFLDILFNQSHDYNTKVDSVIYWNDGKDFPPGRRTAVAAVGGYKALPADLNADGRLDLIVANRFDGTTHHVNSYIYWGTATGPDLAKPTSLPTVGATGVAVGDLNQDGLPDLVFANGGSLEAFLARKIDDRESYIYWGTPGAYSPARRTSVAAVNPVGVVVTDLDGDGLPEVVFANSGPDSPGLYIYWNSAAGISEQKRQTLAVGDPSALIVADLNGDKLPEIVVTRKNENNALVFWNDKGTITEGRAASFPATGAVCGGAGDLNGDGFPDLVLAGGGQASIYWGAAGWEHYDSRQGRRRTEIETTNVTACAISDLNRDGSNDLVFARYRDEEAFDAASVIYWGNTNGISPDRRTFLPTRGATDVQIGDLNGDSRADVTFINNIGGRTKGDINSYIYMGNGAADYSPKFRTELPGHSNYKASSADLNDDGYTDLVLCNSWDDEPTGAGTAFIYWGGPEGYSPARRQELLVGGGFGSSVADLNRDGYLDLVFSNTFTKEETVHLPRRDFGNKGGVIYWGSRSGYTSENRTLLSAAAPTGNRLADFNNDGFLDILFTTWQGGDAVIFWGGREGFTDARRNSIPSISSVNAEIADLNHDGYLDLILCNHIDRKTLAHKVPSYIYYGGPAGFTPSNRIELPTLGAHDASVVDLNGDTNLDIVFSNYHADTTRTPPSYIYWGDVTGRYDATRRTDLLTNSAAGHMIADLNRDSYPDIVFSNHSLDGDHKSNSFIYWGSPTGFSVAKRTELPTVGPHNMFSVDIGNLYSRKLEEEYESAPYQADADLRLDRLEWEAETPFGTDVRFQVRSAGSKEALAKSQWRGPDGAGGYWGKPGERLRGQPQAGPWFQYRAFLTTPDGGNTPRLSKISVIFKSHSKSQETAGARKLH